MLIMSSCTITKRVHRSGWHVEWKKSYKQSVAQNNSSSNEEKKEFVISNQSSKAAVHTEEPIDVEESPNPIVENDEELNYAPNLATKEELKQTDHPDEYQSQTPKKNKNTTESPADKKVLLGKLLVFLGIILIIAFGLPGLTNFGGAIFQMLGIGAVITGSIIWFKGRRMQEKEGTRDGKSEEAQKYIKIGFILLLIGISIAIGTSILFNVLEPAAASTPDVATEVLTITGGVIVAYALAIISVTLIFLALIFLIMGWTKD